MSEVRNTRDDKTETKREQAEATRAAYIKALVDRAPPLTPEQKQRLAQILRPYAPGTTWIVNRALQSLDVFAFSARSRRASSARSDSVRTSLNRAYRVTSTKS